MDGCSSSDTGAAQLAFCFHLTFFKDSDEILAQQSADKAVWQGVEAYFMGIGVAVESFLEREVYKSSKPLSSVIFWHV